jgi:endopeptidase Clp ATP-binding regulatory subunit ClpX
MEKEYNEKTAAADTGKVPSQHELEKELSEYLSKKYGSRVKIISPFVFPRKEEAAKDEGPGGGAPGQLPAFDMLPEEMESFLESFVVKQNEAKAVLATKVCTHFNRAKIARRASSRKRSSGVGMIKNNVLMIGPTGVGKTYIIKLIAQKLGVPFVKGDATKFSETGYVGGDVEDLVRDLVYEANDNIALAENGIIYLDEIDKIASAHNILGHDVSRTGVQRALLKPMEETDVDLKVPHDPISQIQAIEQYRKTGKKEKRVVNTRNILFIMSGAFSGLAPIIKKRLQSQGIGFEADVRPTEVPWEILKQVTAQDLIEFGFESEFVGRLPVVVVFDELTREDLMEILRNPNNPILMSKRMDFRAYGIEIRFEEEALFRIAELAAEEKTGARGLVSIIEKILIPFEKKLPSTNISRFLVTPEVVEDPGRELEKLLSFPSDPEYERRFKESSDKELYNIKHYVLQRAGEFEKKSGLRLYEGRIDIIAYICMETITDVNTACEDFREMYNYVKDRESALVEELDLELSFNDEAVDELLRRAIQTGQEITSLVEQVARRLEYGLKLVKDRAEVERFTITRDAIVDPEAFLNELIKRFYRQRPLDVDQELQSRGREEGAPFSQTSGSSE